MEKKKIIVVMPAYNAEMTLEKTYIDIPHGVVNEILLCDDGSKDRTIDVAKELGLTIFLHEENKGYGANQKTLYREALKRKADIIVMLHPDYQYDSRKIPELICPIIEGKADIVLGSRILNGGALEKVDWQTNSDDFLFDAQILIKAKKAGFNIAEIAIETRYFKEASQVDFFTGVRYGLGILRELAKYRK